MAWTNWSVRYYNSMPMKLKSNKLLPKNIKTSKQKFAPSEEKGK